jgi:hypothetical protein
VLTRAYVCVVKTVCSTVMVENKLNAHLWKGISSHWSRGSSVSMVSDYGLDDLAIEVRSPAETKDFFCSPCVYTGSGAHPASCPTGNVSPFLEVNRGRGVTLTTHSHPVPRSRMSRSYISSSSTQGVCRLKQTSVSLHVRHLGRRSCWSHTTSCG